MMSVRAALSRYHLGYLRSLVYMLQSTEYQIGPYLRWVARTRDFSEVMYRRTLDPTKPVRLLLASLRFGVVLQLLLGLFLMVYGFRRESPVWLVGGLTAALSYPFVWPFLLVLPVWLARRFIVTPRHAAQIRAAREIFAHHRGDVIAILGSYGKTSMKELLSHVLGAGLIVAATPANKNVMISHAAFAERLTGDEQVILIEYGEGSPGDIEKFADLTHPARAVITGLAPAHLDQYKTLQAVGEDIFSIAQTVPRDKISVNTDSPAVAPFIKDGMQIYGHDGALGWVVTDVRVSLHETTFTLERDDVTIRLRSGLIGRHQIGPLALTAALAHLYGMSVDAIQAAIQTTAPHEHRMQPYQLAGASIIDDTYNGNIEGIRAGTELLGELDATRKIYVTPGLVDQGVETEDVHVRMGKLIAAAKPDIVVLIRHSVTDLIVAGLHDAQFTGELKIIDDPLGFYTNLDQFVAAGDVVLMQNDWPDNYQ